MLQYFQNFKQYAFRLETLQEYSVDEEKNSFSHFLETGIYQDKANNDRQTIIEQAQQRHAKMYRVHCIDFPVSDYIKYELEAYKDNSKKGENILYIDTKDYDVEGLNDYRLFDDKIVLIMEYSKDGKFIGFQKETKNIKKYIKIKNEAIRIGVPINQILLSPIKS